jgi:hypothetical protein
MLKYSKLIKHWIITSNVPRTHPKNTRHKIRRSILLHEIYNRSLYTAYDKSGQMDIVGYGARTTNERYFLQRPRMLCRRPCKRAYVHLDMVIRLPFETWLPSAPRDLPHFIRSRRISIPYIRSSSHRANLEVVQFNLIAGPLIVVELDLIEVTCGHKVSKT